MVYHDNAPSQFSKVVVSNSSLQVTQHFSYSPGVTLSNHYVFPNMEKQMAEEGDHSTEYVVAETIV